MQETLKDILISAGKIDVYYEAAPVNLWRARRLAPPQPVFALVEEEKILSSGEPRPADITIEVVGGQKWVRCRPSPRGISTFDAPNLFRGKDWEYYRIPAGTVLPRGLAIIKDAYNRRFAATHYTIAPAFDMPLDEFRRLLDQLANQLLREAA